MPRAANLKVTSLTLSSGATRGPAPAFIYLNSIMEPRLLHGHRFPRADVVWHHCPSTQSNHNTVFLFLVPWSWNELLSEPGRQEPLHDRSSAQSTCSDSKLTRILVQFYLICCVVFFWTDAQCLFQASVLLSSVLVLSETVVKCFE